MAVGRGWREGRVLRRLDRGIGAVVPAPRNQPCIEQIAAELRRLGRQRNSGLNLYSQRWQSEVVRAYDCWLSLACRCLGVPEHLDQLTGDHRNLERRRIELALESAGLALRPRY